MMTLVSRIRLEAFSADSLTAFLGGLLVSVGFFGVHPSKDVIKSRFLFGYTSNTQVVDKCGSFFRLLRCPAESQV